MPQSAPPTRTKKRMTFILAKACTLLLSNNTQTFHQPMHKNVKAVTLLVSTLYHVQNLLYGVLSHQTVPIFGGTERRGEIITR